MKLIGVVAAFSSNAMVAYAGIAQMEAHLIDLLTDRPSTRGAAFTAFFRDQISQIIDSGCWCVFDDDHYTARGTPVENDVDVMCKALHHGYDCAKMDAKALGDNACVPWHVDYVANSGLTTHKPKMVEECRFNNGGADNCATFACAVETNFVYKVFEYMQSNTFNTTWKHENGFSQSESCGLPVQGTTLAPPVTVAHVDLKPRDPASDYKQCCGELPERFTFRHNNGERACCVNKTYDSGSLSCCADGSVKATC